MGAIAMFMPNQRIRRFGFIPYYYNPEETEDEDGRRRIKFKRIRRSPKPEKKPVRRWLILLIGIAFIIWYLHKAAGPQKIEVQDIRIEDVSPSNNSK